MKTFGRPILAFVLFLVIQLVVSMMVIFPVTIFKGMKQAAETGSVSPEQLGQSSSMLTLTSIALILSSIVTIIFMWKPMGMVNFKESFSGLGIDVRRAVLVVLAAYVGVFGFNLISEMIDLPNIIEAQLTGMSATVLGFLAISLVGPVAEEVTMRGAIQGWLHKHEVKPWVAILFASFLFGVMHLNPAQIPFAMIMGIILGVVYWRTGSLVLPCIIHIINNTIACILMNTVGEDYLMYEHLGGKGPTILLALGCIMISAAGLYWQLKPAGSKKVAE
jgi:hypothetical protein